MEPYMSQKRGNWGTASSTETWNTVYFCGYTCGHTENTQRNVNFSFYSKLVQKC